MLSIVSDGTTKVIANSFDEACFVLEGKTARKVYEVWSGKHAALVVAVDGDEAGRMFNRALASDGIKNPGYSFRIAGKEHAYRPDGTTTLRWLMTFGK